jgi:uncharacterized protein (TIGR02001 family)
LRNCWLSIIGPAALCAASALAAGELTYSLGVDYTSNYISNGVTQTRGKPALQAFIEADINGFYAGTWMSRVDFGTDDSVEVDLYLGYRTTFANEFYLDVGYAHYLYDDTGECCGEFKLTGAYPIMKDLGLVGYVAYNPRSGDFNKSVTLAYAINDKFGLSGKYGKTDFNNNLYWYVGGSLAINEFLSGSIHYHGAQTGNEGLVFTLSLATNQSNFARLLTNPFGR